MLTEHQSGGRTVWVDLYNPTNAEIAQACTVYDVDIPPREQLEEIEFSSRLQYEDEAFTISVPVTPHVKNGGGDVTTPLGFVLTRDLLVTVRFAQLHTFEAITARVKRRPVARSPMRDATTPSPCRVSSAGVRMSVRIPRS